jgi:hypothetical protein
MIMNEELYHEKKQIENPNHYIYGKAYLAENIMNNVQAYQPYVGITNEKSLKLAQDTFMDFMEIEMKRSHNYRWEHRYEIEKEAKAAVGASHRCAMPCAKPDCQ